MLISTHSVVDVTGDGSEVWCCKEQYCIGTWNSGSMNQCKLEVVKQEMARVNINILGISELKWIGMGEFNSDDLYIMGLPYSSVGKESACNAGDPGSFPGSGRCPGEENGNSLQYPCLENPMGRGAWWAPVHEVTRVGLSLASRAAPPLWARIP